MRLRIARTHDCRRDDLRAQSDGNSKGSSRMRMSRGVAWPTVGWDHKDMQTGPSRSCSIRKRSQPSTKLKRFDRRRILHFNVTKHPASPWIVEQLREAFPFESVPRFLIFDRDSARCEAKSQLVFNSLTRVEQPQSCARTQPVVPYARWRAR